MLSHVRRTTRDVWWNLRREPTSSLASILTSAVALTLLGIAMLANAQIASMKDYWYDKVEVSVFLCTDASVADTCAGEPDPSTKEALADRLEGLPVVQNVYYETRQDAWNLFQDRFAGTELASNVTAEALPESFRVKLVDPDQGAIVAQELAGTRGVESVQDQRQMLESFFGVLSRIQTAAGAIALLALLAAAALIAAGVRVAVSHRKQELSIMRMVGASAGTIRRPFLISAVIQGAIGGVIAGGAVLLIRDSLLDGQVSTGNLVQAVPQSSALLIAATAFAVGVFVAGGVSALSLRRHLRR